MECCNKKSFSVNRTLLVCLGIVAIVAIAKLVFNVPFGTLFYIGAILACPLMHIFMMGHGEHKDNQK